MPITNFALELKSLSDKGEFEGLAAVYSNADEGREVILPGAFTRTLQVKREVPIFLEHRDAVGTGVLTDSPAGLLVTGKLSLNLPKAQEAYTQLKDGIARGLSIGFKTILDRFENGARQLVELKVYEVSITALPMNELATVTGFKSRSFDQARVFEALRDLARESKYCLREEKPSWNRS